MGIEKKAALICVVVLSVLFGIGLSNREDRPLPKDDKDKRSRVVAQRILEDLNNGVSTDLSKGNDVKKPGGKKRPKPEPKPKAEPKFRYVKVKFRDNFSKIAARELGSATRYPTLVNANPKLRPRNLREGQKVRIPVASDVKVPEPQTTAVKEKPKMKAKTYRVSRDETLSGIAQTQYGKASQWKKIFAANRHKLSRPESLQAGMLIKIP